MKKTTHLLFTMMLLVFSTRCAREQKTTVIKLAHGLDPSHPVHQAMVFMDQQLQAKSHGKYRIDIYPSQQLGTERECIELLQIGSLGMTKVSCSVLESFVPAFSVFSLPYLFRDDAQRYKVLEGEIGRQLLLDGQRFWVRGLCFFDAGSRNFYTIRQPIRTPDDLRGLKIRTQESPTSLKMIQAFGGSATPIAWGELYTALQQGIVDGAENNPPTFFLSHHYEVCRYYVLDEHTSVPDVLLVSTVIWNSLPPQAQQWLQEAANAAAEHQKILWQTATAHALAEVAKAGVQVIRPDKRPFQDKVVGIYREYQHKPELAALIEKIRAVQ